MARARAKDETGKVQRNHFGKQRLNILGKNLGASRKRNPQLPSRNASGPEGINLAHAHRDVGLTNAPAEDRTLRVPHSVQPVSANGSESHKSSSPASRSHSSRILYTLDASERTFAAQT